MRYLAVFALGALLTLGGIYAGLVWRLKTMWR